MKYLKTMTLVVALLLGGLTVAAAETCDPQATTMTAACERQQIASRLPEVVGVKITTTNVSCLTVWASQPSALVLAEGRVAAGEAVDGRVITSWRVQTSMWAPHPSGGYTREICIPTASLLGEMTLCNDENRSVWSNSDVAYLKRKKRIPASDPACLLGPDVCGQFGL